MVLSRVCWTRSVRSGAYSLLGLALLAVACSGIVFWAWQASVLGVLLSALVPGFGAVWALSNSSRASASIGEQPGGAQPSGHRALLHSPHEGAHNPARPARLACAVFSLLRKSRQNG